jgi:hypothetical protein
LGQFLLCLHHNSVIKQGKIKNGEKIKKKLGTEKKEVIKQERRKKKHGSAFNVSRQAN